MVSINFLALASILSHYAIGAPVDGASAIVDFIRYGTIDIAANCQDPSRGLTYGEVYQTARGGLHKRTDITVCLGNEDESGTCTSDSTNIVNLVEDIAGLIQARQGECGESGVSAVEATGLYYKFQSTGSDCRTTAEPNTAAGAIKSWISNQNSGKVCKSQCVQLKHGTGAWTGYVAFGTDQSSVSSVDCSSSIDSSVSKCESGGNADI